MPSAEKISFLRAAIYKAYILPNYRAIIEKNIKMNEQDKNSKTDFDNEPDIQPSEPKNEDSNVENKSGDPGRTPGKAEGSREIVEEDLEQKNQGIK